MLFDLPMFTLVHVVLSLFGIIAGLIVAGGMLAGTRPGRWTDIFLTTTILTNVTGFGFPFTTILPSHIVGVVSLVALSIALFALYAKRLVGSWRTVFVATAILSLYLNVFVLVAQLLAKIPVLAELAPGPQAPLFGITQGVVLLLFIALGWGASKRFPNETV